MAQKDPEGKITSYGAGYYNTLGVEKGASKDEIKKAFHKLAHKNVGA